MLNIPLTGSCTQRENRLGGINLDPLNFCSERRLYGLFWSATGTYESGIREIGRTVSESAEIDGEIHALCDARIAAEGRIVYED
jgi:hypothetical protein